MHNIVRNGVIKTYRRLPIMPPSAMLPLPHLIRHLAAGGGDKYKSFKNSCSSLTDSGTATTAATADKEDLNSMCQKMIEQCQMLMEKIDRKKEEPCCEAKHQEAEQEEREDDECKVAAEEAPDNGEEDGKPKLHTETCSEIKICTKQFYDPAKDASFKTTQFSAAGEDKSSPTGKTNYCAKAKGRGNTKLNCTELRKTADTKLQQSKSPEAKLQCPKMKVCAEEPAATCKRAPVESAAKKRPPPKHPVVTDPRASVATCQKHRKPEQKAAAQANRSKCKSLKDDDDEDFDPVFRAIKNPCLKLKREREEQELAHRCEEEAAIEVLEKVKREKAAALLRRKQAHGAEISDDEVITTVPYKPGSLPKLLQPIDINVVCAKDGVDPTRIDDPTGLYQSHYEQNTNAFPQRLRWPSQENLPKEPNQIYRRYNITTKCFGSSFDPPPPGTTPTDILPKAKPKPGKGRLPRLLEIPPPNAYQGLGNTAKLNEDLKGQPAESTEAIEAKIRQIRELAPLVRKPAKAPRKVAPVKLTRPKLFEPIDETDMVSCYRAKSGVPPPARKGDCPGNRRKATIAVPLKIAMTKPGSAGTGGRYQKMSDSTARKYSSKSVLQQQSAASHRITTVRNSRLYCTDGKPTRNLNYLDRPGAEEASVLRNRKPSSLKEVLTDDKMIKCDDKTVAEREEGEAGKSGSLEVSSCCGVVVEEKPEDSGRKCEKLAEEILEGWGCGKEKKKVDEGKVYCKLLSEEPKCGGKVEKTCAVKKVDACGAKKAESCGGKKVETCAKKVETCAKKVETCAKKVEACGAKKVETCPAKKTAKKAESCGVIKSASTSCTFKPDPCVKKTPSTCSVKKPDRCAKKATSTCSIKKPEPCVKKTASTCSAKSACAKKTASTASVKKPDPCAKRTRSSCSVKKPNTAVKKTASTCSVKKPDPCANKADPCGALKANPYARKSDPCIKKTAPCGGAIKPTPCGGQKVDPCKKADPCGAKKAMPWAVKKPPSVAVPKRPNPCGKKPSCVPKRPDPCNKKPDPCPKKVESKCCVKKPEPCPKKVESTCCVKKPDCAKKTASTCSVKKPTCAKKTASTCSVKKPDCAKKTASTCSVKKPDCAKKTESTCSVKKPDCAKKTASTCSVKKPTCAKKTASTCSVKKPACAKKAESKCSIKKPAPCVKKTASTCSTKKPAPCAKKESKCSINKSKKTSPYCAKKAAATCGAKKAAPSCKVEKKTCGPKKVLCSDKPKIDWSWHKKPDPCGAKIDRSCAAGRTCGAKKKVDPCLPKVARSCELVNPPTTFTGKIEPCCAKLEAEYEKDREDIFNQVPEVKRKLSISEENELNCYNDINSPGYKNKQYFTYSEMAFYDIQTHLQSERNPPPNSRKPPSNKPSTRAYPMDPAKKKCN